MRGFSLQSLPASSQLINVSRSPIQSLGFLRRFEKVRTLVATNTEIRDLQDSVISMSLRVLSFRGSPISDLRHYRIMVLAGLAPMATEIDRVSVSRDEVGVSKRVQEAAIRYLFRGFIIETIDPLIFAKGDEKVEIPAREYAKATNLSFTEIRALQTTAMLEVLASVFDVVGSKQASERTKSEERVNGGEEAKKQTRVSSTGKSLAFMKRLQRIRAGKGKIKRKKLEEASKEEKAERTGEELKEEEREQVELKEEEREQVEPKKGKKGAAFMRRLKRIRAGEGRVRSRGKAEEKQKMVVDEKDNDLENGNRNEGSFNTSPRIRNHHVSFDELAADEDKGEMEIESQSSTEFSGGNELDKAEEMVHEIVEITNGSRSHEHGEVVCRHDEKDDDLSEVVIPKGAKRLPRPKQNKVIDEKSEKDDDSPEVVLPKGAKRLPRSKQNKVIDEKNEKDDDSPEVVLPKGSKRLPRQSESNKVRSPRKDCQMKDNVRKDSPSKIPKWTKQSKLQSKDNEVEPEQRRQRYREHLSTPRVHNKDSLRGDLVPSPVRRAQSKLRQPSPKADIKEACEDKIVLKRKRIDCDASEGFTRISVNGSSLNETKNRHARRVVKYSSSSVRREDSTGKDDAPVEVRNEVNTRATCEEITPVVSRDNAANHTTGLPSNALVMGANKQTVGKSADGVVASGITVGNKTSRIPIFGGGRVRFSSTNPPVLDSDLMLDDSDMLSLPSDSGMMSEFLALEKSAAIDSAAPVRRESFTFGRRRVSDQIDELKDKTAILDELSSTEESVESETSSDELLAVEGTCDDEMATNEPLSIQKRDEKETNENEQSDSRKSDEGEVSANEQSGVSGVVDADEMGFEEPLCIPEYNGVEMSADRSVTSVEFDNSDTCVCEQSTVEEADQTRLDKSTGGEVEAGEDIEEMIRMDDVSTEELALSDTSSDEIEAENRDVGSANVFFKGKEGNDDDDSSDELYAFHVAEMELQKSDIESSSETGDHSPKQEGEIDSMLTQSDATPSKKVLGWARERAAQILQEQQKRSDCEDYGSYVDYSVASSVCFSQGSELDGRLHGRDTSFSSHNCQRGASEQYTSDGTGYSPAIARNPCEYASSILVSHTCMYSPGLPDSRGNCEGSTDMVVVVAHKCESEDVDPLGDDIEYSGHGERIDQECSNAVRSESIVTGRIIPLSSAEVMMALEIPGFDMSSSQLDSAAGGIAASVGESDIPDTEVSENIPLVPYARRDSSDVSDSESVSEFFRNHR